MDHFEEEYRRVVASLETITDLDPNIQAQIKDRLAHLAPPKNMTDAKVLASAGELVIPFLAEGAKRNSNTAAACIRALSLIGGEAALLALEKYSGDRRQSVIKELIKVRSAFKLEEYDLRILSKLHQANLSEADLHRANLHEANLHGTNLSRANLSEVDLSQANLSLANLHGANLLGANLHGANLHGAAIDDKTQIDDEWRLVWEVVNVDMEGSDLREADLSGADLRWALLSHANLGGANLSGANLSGADLYQANLSGADLYGASLSGANLSQADLSQANLREADLSWASLREANLYGANLRGASYNERTSWPEDFDPEQRQAIKVDK